MQSFQVLDNDGGEDVVLSNHKKWNKIFDGYVAKRYVQNAIVCIFEIDGTMWSRSVRGRTADMPMAIASISKLFTTACIIQLFENGKLSLDDTIARWLPSKIIQGLHANRNTDYSNRLTVRHLLTQTSGLPDYFEYGKQPLMKRLMQEDMETPIELLADWTRNMTPPLKPHLGRAYYSDMNFDLLGAILENVSGQKIADLFESQILKPLGLRHTYAVRSEGDHVPVMFVKNTPVHIPKYLKSCPASGGVISTPTELYRFLKAFWSNELFNTQLRSITVPTRMQMPGVMRYAAGYMHIDARIPFRPKRTLIGHSGTTGCYAFYCPEDGRYYIGDLNQCSHIVQSVNMLLRMCI